jgi:hypothetical protein
MRLDTRRCVIQGEMGEPFFPAKERSPSAWLASRHVNGVRTPSSSTSSGGFCFCPSRLGRTTISTTWDHGMNRRPRKRTPWSLITVFGTTQIFTASAVQAAAKANPRH